MSCLSLRLPPAKKAWKNFTSKLQSKLRKLHRSKAIRKPKHRLHAKTAKASLFLEQRKKGLAQPRHSPHVLHRIQRKSGPVYIDKLFKESVPKLMETLPPPPAKETPRNMTGAKISDQGAQVAAGTSKQNIEGNPRADVMWESVGLTSPQMQGIDERAEKFIVSFRAEMQLQEMIARDL